VITITTQNRSLKFIIVVVLLALLLTLSAWIVERQLVSTRHTHFDFGRSPYTDAIMLDIQRHTLGHPAAPDENQYRFVYPAYLALILFPLPLLPFWTGTSA